jgi:hypothetical protein
VTAPKPRIAVGIAVLGLFWAHRSPAAETRLNTVVILADDLTTRSSAT